MRILPCAILVALFCLYECSLSEPICSKYDFEEKLLEKVIRMEIKVEAIAENEKWIKKELTQEILKNRQYIEDTKENLNSDVNDIKESAENNTQTVQRIIQELKGVPLRDRHNLSDTDRRLDEFESDLQKTKEALDSLIAEFREGLDVMKNMTEIVDYVKSQIKAECQPGPAMARALVMGTRVHRGPDWEYGNQDGNPPGLGTITDLPSSLTADWLIVSWDDGGSNRYRMGVGGKYDLTLEQCPF